MTKTSLLAGVAFAITAMMGSAHAQQTITMQFGHLANEQNVWHKAAVRFAEELSTLTDGRLEVEVYPNESLGREMDLINGMQLGTVDMTITGESLPELGAERGPARRPLCDRGPGATGPGRQRPDRRADFGRDHRAGQRPPDRLFRPRARNLTANRAIETPDDLNGMRLRVPNVPLFLAVWSALGARRRRWRSARCSRRCRTTRSRARKTPSL